MKYLILPLFVAIAGCSAPEAQESKSEDHQVKPSGTKAEQVEKPAEKQAAKQDEAPPYTLKRDDLGAGVYMLSGRGGNIGLSVGDDGAFVIDDQFARFSDTILAEIDALSDGPIRFVINTHYHGDHSGSNQEMRDTGADIVAHDNVRVRM
ncbi:MAG: MBL fold metallo-hydrolase, partial [Hellea sp.]|nr:MBL fold metallo-hydrolase [Hellea sp.]